ncbi:hypothetical protein F5148DRAFT_503827 [Russula earlei]|uniref:Uncharacterized protein n=1 Tax=Russula earlei TaxID=71964 RepID=A0ACC0TX46_9AGAM|nr:hypothetical protein F5148DRAFT_503827 [Russula earlei]
MSDSPPPLRPKPGSLRDRIAAFEQKPPSSPTPPLAPRPKPGNLSQWKPHAHTPHDAQPANNRNDPNTSMSASDAKESITKAGSLKERMAALQGLGAFGGVPTATAAAALPSKPSERPKWKPPPQVAVAPPVTGNEDEEDSERADSNKSAVSPLRAHADAISETLLTPPTPAVEPAQEVPSQTEIEPHVGEEEVPDPEEEQRQRRAAIAARMARLGGTRVGMGPPIFGRKPEIKPKPPVSLPETNEDVSVSATPLAAEVASRPERDIEHAQTEIEIAANVPIPISPHTVDKATEEPSLISSLEYFPQQAPASASPNIPSRAMPVPQGPRRPAPPRKKSSQKPTPPAELEAATSPSLDKDEFSHTSTDAIPECQSPPSPVPGHVALQVSATDTISDVSPPEPADGHLGPTKQSFSVDALPVLSPEAGSVPAPPLRPASPSLDMI